MLLTPHALVGAAIGVSTNNIPLIIILAFASHFILDALPHYDWGTWHNYQEFKLEKKDYIMVITDIITVLILVTYLWDNLGRNNNLIIGSFFGILTDLIDNVPFWNRIFEKLPVFSFFNKLHRKIHANLSIKYWYWGIITQVIIVIITLKFLISNF